MQLHLKNSRPGDDDSTQGHSTGESEDEIPNPHPGPSLEAEGALQRNVILPQSTQLSQDTPTVESPQPAIQETPRGPSSPLPVNQQPRIQAAGPSLQATRENPLIKAVPQKLHQVYVGNLVPNTRLSSLREFIITLGVNSSSIIDIALLRRNHNSRPNCSFCVSLNSESVYQCVLTSDKWPSEVTVRPFTQKPQNSSPWRQADQSLQNSRESGHQRSERWPRPHHSDGRPRWWDNNRWSHHQEAVGRPRRQDAESRPLQQYADGRPRRQDFRGRNSDYYYDYEYNGRYAE